MPESSGKKLPSPLKLHYFLADTKGEGEGEKTGLQNQMSRSKNPSVFLPGLNYPRKAFRKSHVHEDTTKLTKQPFKLERSISNSREPAWNSGHLGSNLSSSTSLLWDLRQVTSRAVPQFPLVLHRAGNSQLPPDVLWDQTETCTFSPGIRRNTGMETRYFSNFCRSGG